MPQDTTYVQKQKIKKTKKAQTAVERRQKMNIVKSKVSKSGLLGELNK